MLQELLLLLLFCFARFYPQQLKPQRTRSKNYFEWHLPAFVWENSFNHQSVFPKWSQASFAAHDLPAINIFLNQELPVWTKPRLQTVINGAEVLVSWQPMEEKKTVQTQTRCKPTCPNNSAVKQISHGVQNAASWCRRESIRLWSTTGVVSKPLYLV